MPNEPLLHPEHPYSWSVAHFVPLPNEPLLHPEHPYSWSVAHFVPRLVIKRGDTVTMEVRRTSDRLEPIIREHRATFDGLVQGFMLETVPPDYPPPEPDDPPTASGDPYFWPMRVPPMIESGCHLAVTVRTKSSELSAAVDAPVDCRLAGFGLQVARVDWERRKEIDRIAKEAEAEADDENSPRA